ncbi:MAG TPA: amino acid adenylation domain-containing protein [Thermoanaerobaculia bacterium]
MTEVLTPDRLAGLTREQRAQLFEKLRRKKEGAAAESRIPRRPPGTDIIPLSFAQERLWFLDRLQPGGAAYNVPLALSSRGALDPAALAAALGEVVRRHEALRTTFRETGRRPVQVVSPPGPFAVPLVDLSALPAPVRAAEARQLAGVEGRWAFDLERGPLLRATLLRLGPAEHALLLNMHHIVSDGWSMGVLVREIGALYPAALQGSPSPLPELSIQYPDFALWQRRWLTGEVLERQLVYWRERLAGAPASLDLPADRSRPAVQSFRGARARFAFGPDLTRALHALGRRHDATLFMTLLAGFQALLGRYTGQEDALVGSPIANRNRQEIAPLIGFFVNTLALRADLAGDPAFDDLLGRVRRTALDAYTHQDLPFERLVEELRPERHLSHNPLFQVMFALQNAPMGSLDLPGISLAPLEFEVPSAQFDLELSFTEAGEGLELAVIYGTDLFEPSTIRRLAGHLEGFLAGAAAAPGLRLSELPLLASAERHQLLRDWNDTGEPEPVPGVIARFEAQARRAPGSPAVIAGGEIVPYGELNRRANRLAHRLRRLGVGSGTAVGLCAERSAAMVAGLLGIWKAGAAYVPLDPGLPQARLAFLLEDSGVPVVAVDGRSATALPLYGGRVVLLDGEEVDGNDADPEPLGGPDDLAYFIYTSGTTGQPKAVMVERRHLEATLAATRRLFRFGAADRMPCVAPFSFDVFLFELLSPLLAGGVSHLLPLRPALDVEALVDALEEATLLHAVPALMRQVVEAVRRRPGRPRRLRALFTGGDVVPADLVADLRETFPGARIWILYGPTETAILAAAHPVPADGPARSLLGRPLDGATIDLRDAAGRLVPAGVPGEVWIGGAAVTRGYWQRDDLTAEKFVTRNGRRFFRSGDLARRLPDGALEFLGRTDDQVKVRGFRIELGEVESALARHPCVAAAVVAAWEDDGTAGKRLVAYVVPCEADEPALVTTAAEHVAQWQTLYDDTYGRGTDGRDAAFNLQGWNSSYTGEPIPAEEMREWVDGAVGRLLALDHRRVLEVGCGTGLLLFRVAPDAECYEGTDFSPVVLDLVRQEADRRGLAQVALARRAADDWSGVAAGSYDLVVLNSVVQYFPGVDYLLRVLAGAVRAVRPGGAVFVGDVRSLPLLEAFHASVERFRAGDSLSEEELRRRVRRRMAEEEELVLDPALFRALARTLPIRRVEVLRKRGRYRNELTRFRYDVVLHVGAAPSPSMPVPPVEGSWRSFANDPLRTRLARALVPELRRALQAELPDYMVPSAFVLLDALPLTVHGKVDRAALPAPPRAGGSTPPRTTVETALAELWREILGADRVGLEDNFFDLGGHSLLATQLVSRIRIEMGMDLPLRTVFEAPTLGGLAAEVAARRGEAAAAGAVGLRRAAGSEAPLSFSQERLWFLDRLLPGTSVYNIPSPMRLRGPIHPDVLERCFAEVLRRHEALRTRFEERDGTPVQVVDPPAPIRLPVMDLSALPAPLRQAEAERVTGWEAALPFELERGPVARFSLLRLGEVDGEEEHVVLMTMHHVVSDGWSVGVLFRELTRLYEAFVTGRPSPLPPLPVQYADFARWQRSWLTGERLEIQLAYWRERLASHSPGVDLPLDRPRPAVQTFRGASARLELPGGLSGQLRSLARAERASAFMVLLAAFGLLLQRLSGQDDLLVGTPVAGRTRAEVEGLIGFFLNTLVLRTDLSGNPGFRELVRRVRTVALEAYAHQDIPFERLLEDLQPERDLSRTPLFQVFFNMLNLPGSRAALPGGVSAEPLGFGEMEAKFDLTVYAVEGDEGFLFNFLYNADLFDRERVEEMVRQYRSILEQVAGAPDLPVGSVSLLTLEAAVVLPDPAAPLSEEGPGLVHELFADCAALHPERPAVTDPDGTWAYGELNGAADRLAAWLRQGGIGPGDCVAVHAHRSAPLVWAVFGALKAGAAFVILDPAYPPARLAAMVDLVRPRALLEIAAAGPPGPGLEAALTKVPLRLTLPGGGPEGARALLAELPEGPAPEVRLGPDDLAVIGFTSGSTGVPKGILGRHGPLSHFLPWQCERFGLTAADRYSMLSGLSHDPLQRDVFTPLCTGAALCVPAPEEIGAPGRLAAWMAREGITVAHLTPALGQVLTEPPGGGAGPPTVPSLRWVLLVGDVLTRLDVDRLRGIAPRVACVNLYGSTETQRAVGYHVAAPEAGSGADRAKQILPLGRGMKDVQLLVLNAAGRLAGIGEVGEICVRSPHLARGYLGDEPLTRERFQESPFTRRPDDRIYRTGDLGRYLPNGEATFAGRADQQVKIRGFRIELGEIEAVLGRLPGVREAAAVARQDPAGPPDRRLVAYVVPDPDRPAEAGALREALRERLPVYMIPSAFVMLDRLPLSPNGKVDRRALPGPAQERGKLHVPPATPTEEALAGIWEALLDRRGIGAHDDFFELGGHSLLATRVAARVRDAFAIELPLPVLFQETTLAGLAAWIDRERAQRPAAAMPKLQARRRAGAPQVFPLSSSQRGVWFLDRRDPGNPNYVTAVSLRLMGGLDRGALARALNEIVRRHEALRVRFEVAEGEPVQVLQPSVEIPLPLVDLAGVPEEVRGREAGRIAESEGRRGFDLSRGPLLRSVLLQLREGEHAAIFAMHHIVSDGWSMGVLVREVAALYAAFSQGRPSPLPELPVQYLDWVEWQRERLSGEVLAGQLAWWQERLEGAPALELPTDRHRPPVPSFHGAVWSMEPPPMPMDAFRDLCQRHGATPFMVLLAAFGALLQRCAGQDGLVVGTAVANRRHSELEDLIGLFVNTLALPIGLAGDPPFRELLARVRTLMVDAYARQDLPFERLVAELGTGRDPGRSPLFQVFLQVQNVPTAALELPGLSLDGVDLVSETAKFELVVNLRDTPAGVLGEWRYATELFDPATVARMSRHFGILLAGATASEEARLSELPLLTAGERHQLLHEWNAPAPAAGPRRCLHERFAAVAARDPEAVAAACGGERLTYGELDRRANRLAHRLRRLGVHTGDRVALFLGRSLDLVVALLGALKAGAAYVPLDPAYPRERLAFALGDSRASILLTQERLRHALPEHPGRTLFLDMEDLAGESAESPRSGAGPGAAAYVIYTSGSTGRPKGVLVRHAEVDRLFAATDEWFGFSPGDVWTLFHSHAFDFSVWELWGALLHGGRLVVVPFDVSRTPARFYELLEREEVTVLNQTPSAFRQLVRVEESRREPARLALRYVIFGGEALELASLAPWFERHGDRRPLLVNMYGITETTVHATWRLLRREDLEEGRSAIGRAIPDLRLAVLDRNGQPVPIGVPGELCVGGAGLAAGYLDRPDLTAARFVPAPFAAKPGSRLYRSGDLARHLPDGDLEYLGRIDHQVKIRGFRVELGEIEAALAAHPAVREAVAGIEGAGEDARILAWVVPRGEAAPALGELRSFLARSLPDYMLPSILVPLRALPLTPSGKVDRRALPAPGEDRPGPGRERVAPRDGLERWLAEVWREVLKVREAGVHDDFFELGGNSISAAVAANRLQEELGEIVHVVTVFDHPTVAGLAGYLRREHPRAVARRLGGGDAQAERDDGPPLGAVQIEEVVRLARRTAPRSAPGPRNPRAVLLLSPPRSGSTLLRVLLAGNLRLFAPPELELLSFDTLAERRDAFAGRDAFWLEGLIRAVMQARGVDAGAARALVEEGEAAGWTTQRFYGRLQEWIGDRLLVDKTPSYALDPGNLERAEETFEEPLYIHLLRHPCGMIRSFEEAKLDQLFFRHPHSLSRRRLAEALWDVSHENVLGFLARVPAERWTRVSFEELLRDPEPVLRGLCQFLGVPFDPGMLEPYADASSRMTDGIHRESRMLGDVKFHQHTGMDAAVADRWRGEIDEAALGEPTRELAVRLGYPLARPASWAPLEARPWRPGEPLPLSFAQERLWFLDQLEGPSPTYNIPAALRLLGRLDVPALARSLGEIVRRHAVLRTRFAALEGGPIQVVDPPAPFPLPVIDLSGLPPQTRDGEARRLAAAEAVQPFDLARGPVLRGTLLRLEPGEHAVLFTLHHIAGDGWSMGVLTRELAALYGAFAAGRPSPLPEPPIQYVDYARWQRERLAGDTLRSELAFWREALATAPVLELPTDRPRPPVQTFRGATRPFRIGAGPARALAALGQGQGATLFMTLLAGFAALLARHAGQDDLSLGSPVAGRPGAQLEGLIGFFVNTLVLRMDAAGDPSFRDLVARARETALAAFRHQEVPFERVVEEVQPGRDLSRSPLFQAFFALQNAPTGPLELPGLTLAPFAAREEVAAKFDLTLSVVELPDGLLGRLDHNVDLFDPATAARLAGRLTALLEGAAAGPDLPLSRLPLLSPAERHQLLAEWNDTQEPAPAATPLERFEAAAAVRPDALALVWDGGRLTRGELDRRANTLARRLRGLGVGPEIPVGVVLPRSAELVLAAVAVAKAGGVYLPLDPAWPEERIAAALGDAGARVVMTLASLAEKVRPGERTAIALDGLGGDVGEDAVPPEPLGDSRNLAYVVFTSGSTGRPKGVTVERRSLANLIAWHCRAMALSSADRYTLTLGPAFDASLLEIWAPLAAGAAACILDEETRLSPAALAAWAAREEITVLNLPTPVANALLAEPLPPLPALRLLYTGGDRLARLPRRPGFTVVNLYGPSEATVTATWEPAVEQADRDPVIGRPIANARVSVLDERLLPVPLGCVGELFLGGEVLARGYLGRPDLTAEAYLPDPFAGEPGARLYRTGDLVRSLPGGRLDMLGRRDGQVKVRGFRIELGEIEAVLRRHPAVKQAVVAARGEGTGRRLVACLVGEIPEGDLREHLRRSLPEFMIPSSFVTLSALPLTPSGKVDLQALPDPEAERSGFVAPRGTVEEGLAEIWARLLEVERVGARDNFFELGGHSLLAHRVVSAVRERFGVDLPLRALFEGPTVEALAAAVRRARAEGLEAGEIAPIERRPRRAGEATRFPLSLPQVRDFTLDRDLLATAVYNMPGGSRVSGPLSVPALRAAVREVVKRHEALRTVFAEEEGEPVQVALPDLAVPVPLIDLSALPQEAREAEARCLTRATFGERFDLARGPLLRIRILRLAAGDHLVPFVMHHIISDGWSIGIFLRDLATAYAALSSGRPAALPEPPVQYGDYASWQRERVQGEALDRILGYWQQQLAGAPHVLPLPADHPRPPEETFRGEREPVWLPPEETAGLKALAAEEGASLFIALLAAFQAILSRWSGQEDLLVGTYSGARSRAELEETIGYFLQPLPLRGDLSGGPSFRGLLQRQREVVLGAFAHADLPFERLLEELGVEPDPSHYPLLQVMLVLQNFPMPPLEAAGVSLTPIPVGEDRADFDLTLWLSEAEGGLAGRLDYSTDLFEPETIHRLLGGLQALIRAALAEPDRPLADLPLLGEDGRVW